jgi:hypothetical protein
VWTEQQQYQEISKSIWIFTCGRNIGGSTFTRKQQTAYRVECIKRNKEVDFINGGST